MLNNFAMQFIQIGKFRECSQILQLAYQMYQHQQEFQDNPKMQTMFYSNFSTYHLYIGKKGANDDDKRAKTYIDGAL